MKRRFQIYMRMVDVSFWVSALFLANFAIKLSGHKLLGSSPAVGVVFRIVVISNFALAIFVVLARFMRDEHAERIWQLTARRFVNSMVAVCAIAAVALPATEERFNRYVASRDWKLPPEIYVAGLNASQVMVKYTAAGFGMALMIFGFFAPLIFIVLYKGALWRDSR